MYNKSKYYKVYLEACEEARKNIQDQEEYAKCIQGLNNWMDQVIAREQK